jgi:hypothetical protein
LLAREHLPHYNSEAVHVGLLAVLLSSDDLGRCCDREQKAKSC